MPEESQSGEESAEDEGGAEGEEQIHWTAVTGDAAGYNEIDMTEVSEVTLDSLPPGIYRLEETGIPEGYITTIKFHYFVIEVTSSGRTVSLCDENGDKVTGKTWGNATLSTNSDGIYIITIKNTPGEELPMTGGLGRGIYAFLGMLLIAAAGVLLLRPGRRLI